MSKPKEDFMAYWNANMEIQVTPENFKDFKDEYIEWLEDSMEVKL